MSALTAKIIDIGDESMLGLCEDGRKIWLEGPAVPGDRVSFEQTGKTGRVTGILSPAEGRREACCPHFSECRGCQLQPLPAAEQRKLKARKIVETLRRLGGFSEVPFEGMAFHQEETGTRNKLDFSVEGSRLGYQSAKGLLEVSVCPVGDPLLNQGLAWIREWLKEHPRNQLHRCLLRTDSRRKSIGILLRGQLAEAEQASLLTRSGASSLISSVALQEDWRSHWENLYGESRFSFVLADTDHSVSHDAFFQVHDRLADRLVRDTMAELGEGGTKPLLDLFCGVGAFTLPAQTLGWQVLGIDSRPGKGPFQKADLRKGLPRKVLNPSWHTVITDPPRSGMEKLLCTQIRDQLRPRELIYISCNPATLARDLQRICAKGAYQLRRVKGYDLFPQTTHVETVAYLSRSAS